jgi:nucleoside-diphosphate-sugar epimerase
MDQQKILITGASGQIGQKLCKALKDKNYLIEKFNGNINDTVFLEDKLKNIDITIHLAGMTHTNKIHEYYQINTEGTENLVKVCKSNGVKKIIYISTRAVGNKKIAGEYGHSKLLAEEIIKKSGMNFVILRPAEIYGPGLPKSMIEKLIIKIKQSKTIPVIGNGLYKLAPVHVDDIIAAIITSIGNKEAIGKTYTLAGPENYSYIELIDNLAKQFNKKTRKIYLPIHLAKIVFWLLAFLPNPPIFKDQLPRLLCDKENNIKLAQQDLDFKPRNIFMAVKIVN